MVVRRIGFVLGSLALVALLMAAGGKAAEQAEPDDLGRCTAGEWKAAPHRPSILSVELAGTTERLEAILGCWGAHGEGAAQEQVRDELERGLEDDNRFIGVYVLVLAWWGRYGAKQGWTRRVREAGWVMAGLAATAGVLDLLENCHLSRAYEGDATFAGDITTVATAKWILLLGPVTYAIGMLVVAGGRAVTIVLGGAGAEMWSPDVPPTGLADGLARPKEPTRRRLRETKDHTVLQEAGEPRRQYLQPTGVPWERGKVGIGLSGGGIRAATYSLGAMQGLEELGVVAKARYVVSVSGGGYLATGRQLLQHAAGITGAGAPPPVFAADAAETALLRSRHRYLWNTPRDAARGLGRVLVSIVFNLAVVGTLVFLASWSVGWLARRGDLTGAPGSLDLSPGHLAGAVVAAGALLVAGVVHVSLTGVGGTAFSRLSAGSTGALLTMGAVVWFATLERGWYDSWWAVPIATVGGVILFGVATLLSTKVPRWWTRWLGLTAPAIALGAVALAAGAVLVHQSSVHVGSDLALDGLVQAGVVLLCGLVVVGVAVGAVTLALGHDRRYGYPALLIANALVAAIAIGKVAPDLDLRPREEHVLGVVTVAIVLVYAFLDQKRWSPHVFYKKRLASAFALARLNPTPPGAAAQQMPFAVRTSLSSWMERPNGPELVISAAVHTSNPVLKRDERVWPFSFSQEWVGGPDVGWMRTRDFEAALGRANGGDGSAIAAAAISGAAVASSMGVMSKGSTNAALALANLRLGVWLPSPDYVHRLTRSSDVVTWVRWRRFSYLLKEIVGHFDLQDRFVYVSDGGHLENLGLVELLARRCKRIVLIDASGDKYDGEREETAAGTLRTAMRQSNIRLGIVFTDLQGAPLLYDDATATGAPYERVGDATPAFRTLVTPLVPTGRISPSCCIRLRAEYPADAPSGQTVSEIVLVKSLWTPSAYPEPDARTIADAATGDGKFPRNSTGNQWLTDQLFDGYEALGRQNVAEAADEIIAVVG